MVPASVELLPTPQPGAAQTAVAQDQKALTGASSPVAQRQPRQDLPAWLLVVGLGVVLLVGGLLVLMLRRTRRRQSVRSKNGRRR